MKPDHRRRGISPKWLLIGGACGLFVLPAILSLCMAGPQIQADEGSYLLNAAMMLGRLTAHPDYGYYSGYSVLLLPAFLLASHPDAIYHWALVINALLLATTPFALFQLTRGLWPNDPPRLHVAAALLAACYAPVLLMSQHTMSESALVPLYAWLLASGWHLAQRGNLRSATAFGALTACLYLVHPRGALMAAPVFAIVSLYLLVNRRHRRLLVVAWAAAGALVLVHAPLEQLAGRPPAGGGPTLEAVLDQFKSSDAWRWFAFNLAGTTTEAIVTSFGLFVLGLRAVATETRQAWLTRSFWQQPQAAVLLAAAAAMATSLLVTAAFFVPPQRADQLSYGRYALPTLVPLLAIGVLRLAGTHRTRDLLWALVVGIAGIGLTVWGFADLPPSVARLWVFVNAPGLFIARHLIPLDDPWIAIGVAFVVGTSLIWLAARLSAHAAVGLFAACNVLLFGLVWSIVTLPGSEDYAHRRYVVDTARAFATATGEQLCLRLDGGVDVWHRIDLGWRLFPEMRARTEGASCTSALIRPLRWKAIPDMRLVAVDRPSPLGGGAPIGLFIANGATLDAFAREYALMPTDALNAVPVDERQIRMQVDRPYVPRLRTQAGDPLYLHVRITNLSKRVFRSADADLLPYPIMAGTRIMVDGKPVNTRVPFPVDLAPGQQADMTIKIGPIDRPGTYPLRIGVVQEFVDWFDGSIETTLDVAAPGA